VRNPKQTFSEGAGEKDAGGDRRRRRGRGEERDGWWPAAGNGQPQPGRRAPIMVFLDNQFWGIFFD